MFAKPTLAYIAAVTAGSIVSPAFAQPSYHRNTAGADRQIVRQHDERTISKSARNAFGMAPGQGLHLDPNSPEATCGGGLGYNQNLLIC